MLWMMAATVAWVSASVGVGVVLGRTITRRDSEDRPR
jgi:hypothetical protein